MEVFRNFSSIYINCILGEVSTETESIDICVGPNDNEVVSIKSRGVELGNINITVEAKITNGIDNCKDVDEGEGFADALVRPLRVKPEGFPVEKVSQTKHLFIDENFYLLCFSG